jgi:hypothetical protein
MDQVAFVETLLSETASALQRSAGNAGGLRGVVFLYLNRAYESGLEPDRICDLLGVSQDSVLSRAKLSKRDEASVMNAYESLDPILEQQYRAGGQQSS